MLSDNALLFARIRAMYEPIDYNSLTQALHFVEQRWPTARPAFGMILGSGWSEVAGAFEIKDSAPYEEIPGLGGPGVKGHAGKLLLGRADAGEILIFQGRRHLYEGVGWTPIALPVFVMQGMGIRNVLLTNAAGGINPLYGPGCIMVMRDHINLMGGNPLIGEHNPVFGTKFMDQSRVYDASLRAALLQAGKQLGETLVEGVYLGISGPAYETPAEIRAFKALGADAVGMSTIPEAMLAHGAGMRVAGLSCITNFAAGISKTTLSHEEVVDCTTSAMARLRRLVREFSHIVG